MGVCSFLLSWHVFSTWGLALHLHKLLLTSPPFSSTLMSSTSSLHPGFDLPLFFSRTSIVFGLLKTTVNYDFVAHPFSSSPSSCSSSSTSFSSYSFSSSLLLIPLFLLLFRFRRYINYCLSMYIVVNKVKVQSHYRVSNLTIPQMHWYHPVFWKSISPIHRPFHLPLCFNFLLSLIKFIISLPHFSLLSFHHSSQVSFSPLFFPLF